MTETISFLKKPKKLKTPTSEQGSGQLGFARSMKLPPSSALPGLED